MKNEKKLPQHVAVDNDSFRKNLSQNELLVYVMLKSYMNGTSLIAFPKQSTLQKDTGLSTSRIANSELPNGFGRDKLINFVNQVMERIDDLKEGDELYQIEEEISNNIVNDNDLWTIIEYYADESDRENILFQNAYNKYENDVYDVALKYYNE